MYRKVSVLVPTRHRIDRLQVMLKSYNDTSDPQTSELVFRVDEDDYATQDFLQGCSVLVGPRYGGYKSMPQFFNELYKFSTGDVLMFGNDDMMFETPGWAEEILKAANEYPDGLFDIGYTTLNETHFPFATISRTVCDLLGFFWDPRIFWGDIYWRDIMAHFGRTVMLPHVRITHDWAGFKPDALFMEAQHLKESIGSNEYWNLHSVCIKEAIAKLEPLTIVGVVK